MSARALEASLEVAVGGEDGFRLSAELALDEGVLVLFGPSGAGKTLTLQALAGLVRPHGGRVVVGGEVLFDAARGVDVPAHRRHLGYVPQHHTLFPFCSVRDNVVFGLPRAARRRDDPEVRTLIEKLGLARLLDARPGSLSGGERQRVALARALVVRPRLLLLDEPFASLDHETRRALRRLLRELVAERRTPAVLVTHDPEEARAVGDRLVRYERGHTAAAGPPTELLTAGGIEIVGTPDGAPRALPDGRAELRLRDATVVGPPERLAAGERGFHLELPPRDEPPRES